MKSEADSHSHVETNDGVLDKHGRISPVWTWRSRPVGDSQMEKLEAKEGYNFFLLLFESIKFRVLLASCGACLTVFEQNAFVALKAKRF